VPLRLAPVCSRAGAWRAAQCRAARRCAVAAATSAADADDDVEVLTHEQAFGAAAVADRYPFAVLLLPMLRLSGATARVLTDPDDAESEEDAAASSAPLLYAMDETLSQVAADLGLDASGGGGDADEEAAAVYEASAAAFAALLEAQWASALAAHAAHAPDAFMTVAGVATAASAREADEMRALRAESGDSFSKNLATLSCDAPDGSPLSTLLPLAAASGATDEADMAQAVRVAWLCRLEALLDVAEALESDETTYPSAALVLCGDVARDAPLLTALHALLPLHTGGAAPPSRDRAGALALAPALEAACDCGDADVARALADAALPRLAANRWRSGVRFVASDTLRGDDVRAAAAAASPFEANVMDADLLIVIYPDTFSDVAPDGGTAAEVELTLEIALSRRRRGAQAPLLVALGAPELGGRVGGAALRAARERVASTAWDALLAFMAGDA
jgi:hypothetical protein